MSAGLNVDEIRTKAREADKAWLCSQAGAAPAALEFLRRAAQRHAEGVDPKIALCSYLLACASECVPVAQRFAGSVFLTFSPPNLAFLNPKLPTMFINSHRRHTAEKPWFVDDIPDAA